LRKRSTNTILFLASPVKISCAHIVKIEICRHKQTSEVLEKKNYMIINCCLRVVDKNKMHWTFRI